MDPARIYSGPCEHSCNATLTTQESIEQYLERGYSYARSNNPTVTALERKVAELEGGHAAACFGTGMAATNALMAAMLTAGDHCVITNCSYGGETQHPFHLATAPLSLPFTWTSCVLSCRPFHLDVLWCCRPSRSASPWRALCTYVSNVRTCTVRPVRTLLLFNRDQPRMPRALVFARH